MRPRTLWCAAMLFACASASAQELPVLDASGSLDPSAGCLPYALRCFVFGEAIEGDTAISTATSPAIAIHARDGAAGEWRPRQVITNPDYWTVPSAQSPEQVFAVRVAFGGESLLAQGTSPRYNNKDVIYAYGHGADARWSHLQTLTLQRPSGYYATDVTNLVLSGDTAVVGGVRYRYQSAAGAFTQFDLYKRQANGLWARRGGVRAPSTTTTLYGFATALERTTLVVGDPYAASESGRVYVYEYDAAGWTLRKTLTAPTPQPGAHFGESVAIDNTTIAVGAPLALDELRPRFTGEVFVFDRTNGAWRFSQRIAHPDDEGEDAIAFGMSVNLAGARLIVDRDSSDGPGTFAVLYERGATWRPAAYLATPDYWSYTIALTGAAALVNASNGPYSAESLVFELPPLGGRPGSAAIPTLSAR